MEGAKNMLKAESLVAVHTHTHTHTHTSKFKQNKVGLKAFIKHTKTSRLFMYNYHRGVKVSSLLFA